MRRRVRIRDRIPGLLPSTYSQYCKRYGDPDSWSLLNKQTPVTAKVVYIHPDHRYLVAEFTFPHGGSFRECVWIRRRKA